jgi:hypothetical protein
MGRLGAPMPARDLHAIVVLIEHDGISPLGADPLTYERRKSGLMYIRPRYTRERDFIDQ